MSRKYKKTQEYLPTIEEYVKTHGNLVSKSKLARLILKENDWIKVDIPRICQLIQRVKRSDSGLYSGINEVAEKHGVNPNDVKHLWVKDKESSVFIKNPHFKQHEYNQFKEDLYESIKNHSPKYPKIKRAKCNDGHLLVVDPADVHIGKLASAFETGDEYNCDIAINRAIEGVKGILNKTKGFNIEKILFIGGNDILHIDTPRRTTTSGTPQDTDGMWYDNFLLAKKLYVDLLEILIAVADVHFTYNPSNHDYTNGFFLADVIKTHFRRSKNITFDCSIKHRKGFKYGQNLISTTHGDGAKQQDLPLLLANEFPKEWSETKHRYVYMHHVHHKISKDYIGVTVESLRSPSGTDGWHHRNGYTGAPKAVEGFLHHPEHGQIARITHIF
jgi:hypothetical protein